MTEMEVLKSIHAHEIRCVHVSECQSVFLFARRSNHCQVSFTPYFAEFVQNSFLITRLSSAYVYFLVADTINILLLFIQVSVIGSLNLLLTSFQSLYFLPYFATVRTYVFMRV